MDLLLGQGIEHGRAGAGNGSCIATADVPHSRMEAVDRLLKLLGDAPAEEPPADLVQRTLRRIAQESFSGRAVAASAETGPAIDAPPQA